jgi:23S rRNA (cytosine1962-C5)-methyltransferase
VLKEISLSREGALKLHKKNSELYFGDIEDNVKSCIPGEWVIFKNIKKNKNYLGYVNPLVDNKTSCAHVFCEETNLEINEFEYLKNLIENAIQKRSLFKGYDSHARLVYGNADNLPGLIVDSYANCIIIQINTAGIDRFRNELKEYFQKKFSRETYILDNEKYREREMLPFYETNPIKEDLDVHENGLKFIVSKESLQKVGYYYDHRENRLRASNLVKRFEKKFKNGLDLFSYVGSWGINLLSANCEFVTFVDQGDFEANTNKNLELNGFSGKGKFLRTNVFDYLKECNKNQEKFDLVCSDPPAFCKSKKEQKKAYEGYLKLHKEIFKLLNKDSLFIACSCTYYIDFPTFEQSVLEAAASTGRKVQLIDVGVQGFDHPTEKLINKNTYLKYFAYLVE